MSTEFKYVLLSGFVRAMCDGWTPQFIFEPMNSHHGQYCTLMWREA